MYILNMNITFGAATFERLIEEKMRKARKIRDFINLEFLIYLAFTRYRRENWKTGQKHRLNL